jgi:hypothetical protein
VDFTDPDECGSVLRREWLRHVEISMSRPLPEQLQRLLDEMEETVDAGVHPGQGHPPVAGLDGEALWAVEVHHRGIWKNFELKPHLQDAFKLSTDPQFIAKVVDVVGLYHHPPEKAVALCVTRSPRPRRWTGPSRCSR